MQCFQGHSTFLRCDFMDDSYCSNGILELSRGQKIASQATQATYKITMLKEYAKLNDPVGIIILASGPGG